jgi:hypothetical protein
MRGQQFRAARPRERQERQPRAVQLGSRFPFPGSHGIRLDTGCIGACVRTSVLNVGFRLPVGSGRLGSLLLLGWWKRLAGVHRSRIEPGLYRLEQGLEPPALQRDRGIVVQCDIEEAAGLDFGRQLLGDEVADPRRSLAQLARALGLGPRLAAGLSSRVQNRAGTDSDRRRR